MENNATPGQEVFRATAAQQAINLVFVGLGALFIGWLEGIWRLGSILLFAGLVIMALLEGAHLLAMRRGTAELMKEADPDEVVQRRAVTKWLNRAEILRWFSFVVMIGFVIFVYNRIW